MVQTVTEEELTGLRTNAKSQILTVKTKRPKIGLKVTVCDHAIDKKNTAQNRIVQISDKIFYARVPPFPCTSLASTACSASSHTLPGTICILKKMATVYCIE